MFGESRSIQACGMEEVGKDSAVQSSVACACMLDRATSHAQEQRTDGVLRAEVWVELGRLRLRINVSTSNVSSFTTTQPTQWHSRLRLNPIILHVMTIVPRLLDYYRDQSLVHSIGGAMQAVKPHAQLLPLAEPDWFV
jgi:hypothetical protein